MNSTNDRVQGPAPEELAVIVRESGLPVEEGQQAIMNYQPLLERLGDIQDAARKIDFENPTDVDEKIARELRLKTVKVRTEADAIKDKRKRIYLLHGNLEQAARNLINASCKLAEDRFLAVEKASEIAEAKRIAVLREERLAELVPLGWVSDGAMDIGSISTDMYAVIKSGLIKAREDRAREEQEQAAREKAEAEERRKAEEQRAAEEARMRAENERLRKEREAQERKIAEERAQREAERRAEDIKARRKQVELTRTAAQERREREELEARLAAQVECPYCHKKFVPAKNRQ